MIARRRFILVATLILVLGSQIATIVYALHLRSSSYKHGLEERLSARLGMQLSIGAVEPRSFTTRRFRDVRLRSRQRNVDVFECDKALWQKEFQDDESWYTLTLQQGWLLAGASKWHKDDYERILRTGFGHDFAELRVRDIFFDEIDLLWKHPSFTFSADATSGRIWFDKKGQGHATLEARTLNGSDVRKPVRIAAEFTPGAGMRFHEVDLTIPEAPLAALGLDALVGGHVSAGKFAGNVTYSSDSDAQTVSISGAVENAVLAELTAGSEGGPYDGKMDITLDLARFTGGHLTTLRFGGELVGLHINQIARLLSAPDLTGGVDLRIHRAEYDAGRLVYLSLDGKARSVGLDPLTQLIGGGKITSTLQVDIESLLIVDERIVSARMSLRAVPPTNGPAIIDRELVRRATELIWGFDATSMVPSAVQDIEYAQLGMELDLNGDQLRVRGSHGDQGRTILTIKLFGREFGVIKEPNRAFVIKDPIATLRDRMKEYDARDLRNWWKTRSKSRDENHTPLPRKE
jgi:hypothetical protein